MERTPTTVHSEWNHPLVLLVLGDSVLLLHGDTWHSLLLEEGNNVHAHKYQEER